MVVVVPFTIYTYYTLTIHSLYTHYTLTIRLLYAYYTLTIHTYMCARIWHLIAGHHLPSFTLRVKFLLQLCMVASLVPKPLPDFISQPWIKIGRRPGIIAVMDRKWRTRLVLTESTISILTKSTIFRD